MKNILGLIFGLSLLTMADSSVHLAIETRNATVNEPFEFQIIIEDAPSAVGTPKIPSTENYGVASLGPSRNQSTQISVENGRSKIVRINQLIFRYQIIPKRPGRFELPALVLVLNGKKHQTKAVSFQVGQGEQRSDLVLKLECPRTRVYVGEPLMVTWRLFFAVQSLQNCTLDLPLLDDARFRILPYEMEIDSSRKDHYRQLLLKDGTRQICVLERDEEDGIDGLSLCFFRPVIPLQPGKFELEAGQGTCQIPDSRRSRRNANLLDSFFDDGFFGTPMRTVAFQGNRVALEVLPLPEEGKSPLFSDLFGHFSVEAEAVPQEVNVGDPIVLTVKLKGLSCPDASRLPPFSQFADLNRDFRISEENGGVTAGKDRCFQVTLRARSGNVKQIPSLAIPYFDPETGKYGTVETRAIPLTVREVRTVTAADAGGAVESAVSSQRVRSVRRGIAHNYTWQEMARIQRAGFHSWNRTPWKWILASGICIVWGICFLLTVLFRHFRRNSGEAALLREGSRAEVRLKSHPDPRLLYDLFLQALAGRLGREACSFSPEELKKCLAQKGYPEEMQARGKSLLAQLEAAKFAGIVLADENLPGALLEFLKKL